MYKFIICLLLCRVIGARKVAKPLRSGAAHIFSRHAQGKASLVKFPGISSSSEDGIGIKDFFPTYCDAWSVSPTEMVHIRSRGGASSGITYAHHQQILLGVPVYGGDVVVAHTSHHKRVLRARGHPIPSYLFDKGQNDSKPSLTEADVLKSIETAIAMHFGYGEPSSTGASSWHQGHLPTPRALHPKVSQHTSRLVWYRRGLSRGTVYGGILLAYVVTADALVAGNDGTVQHVIVSAVVCADTGKIESFNDQRGIMKGNNRRLHDHSLYAASTAAREREVTMPPQRHIKKHHHHHQQRRTMRGQEDRGRRMQASVSNLPIQVYDCNGDIACSTASALLVYDSDRGDDIALATSQVQTMVRSTAETANLVKSVSGGLIENFKRDDSRTFKWVTKVNLPEENAYYFRDEIVFGTGFDVDDVIAHEWMHGYTAYGCDYLYEFQPGALNEALSDIIGESVDLLNNVFDGEERSEEVTRSTSSDECTAEYHGGSSGSDLSRRWIVGEDIPLYPKAFRDMYLVSAADD